MEVKAFAKSLRVSPQKMRLVVDEIKKLSPQEAVKVLDFIPKKSAPLIKKVILSAIANAKHNFNLSEDSLIFKQILVSQGAVFKRYRPVARGRAHPILKRTAHLSIILEGKTKKAQENQEEVKGIKATKSKKEGGNGTEG